MKDEIRKILEQAKAIKQYNIDLKRELEDLENKHLIKTAELVANKWRTR